jgi:plasmid stabilization system protein ParE
MSAAYQLTYAAVKDLQSIYAYIYPENPQAAIDLDNDCFAAFETLAANPGIGRLRPDITQKPYRFWAVRSRYVIAYEEGPPISILRVLNTYRNLSVLFQ